MKIKLRSYKLLFNLLDILSNNIWLHKLVVNKKVYLGASIISLTLANNSCSEDPKGSLKDDKSIGETTTCYEVATPDSSDDDVSNNEISSIDEKGFSNQSIKSIHRTSVTDTSPSTIHVTNCYINLGIDNVETETATPIEWDSTIYTITDEDAEFIGGMDSLKRYISKNIEYPPTTSCYVSIDGTVYVRFVVTKTGELTDISVVRGIGAMQDEEALRLVKSMPKWIPARHQGKMVNTYFTLPIQFKLQ